LQAKEEKHGTLYYNKAFNDNRINNLEEILTDNVIHPPLKDQAVLCFINITSS